MEKILNSEIILETIDQKHLIYLTFDELCDALAKFCKILPNKIKKSLSEMIQNGILDIDEKGYVFVTESKGYLKGKLIGHRKGYGFVDISEDDEKDVFIPFNAMNGAIDGDTVLVKVVNRPQDNNPEGKIVKIISRSKKNIVGTVKKQRNNFVLVPDDDKFDAIPIKREKLTNFNENDKVVLELSQNNDGLRLKGNVSEILGKSNTIKAEQLAIIRSFDLRESFNDNILKEARAINKNISPNELNKRKDFTALNTVTIDGEDARDFDDAISVQTLDNGNHLIGVHIADVAHYVKDGGLIDKEAFKRGTSIYFPDLVLPMLPQELSNGICSLMPDENRLTLSVMMELDKNCKVISHEIFESVIKSKARMTYTEVFALINKESEMLKKYAAFVKDFEIYQKIAIKLQQIRQQRGEIRFDIPEPYIKIGAQGEILSIEKRSDNISHHIIESLMVLCNEVIAENFFKQKTPFVYRVHEKPEATKQEKFLNFIKLQGIGFNAKSTELMPKDYQNILSSITDDGKKAVINKILLRSMMKARYSPNCLGHFGLASTFYCHFTSPIRRYPDLLIHRIIKLALHNKLSKSGLEKYANFVQLASEQSSNTETVAEEVERAVDDYKKCVYMSNYIGTVFEGIISSVQDFGIFVELENTTEGMIRFDNLPIDTYEFDQMRMQLKGKKYSYAIGDKVEIVVVNTNVKLRQINFELKSEYEKHADIATIKQYSSDKPNTRTNFKDYIVIKEKLREQRDLKKGKKQTKYFKNHSKYNKNHKNLGK